MATPRPSYYPSWAVLNKRGEWVYLRYSLSFSPFSFFHSIRKASVSARDASSYRHVVGSPSHDFKCGLLSGLTSNTRWT